MLPPEDEGASASTGAMSGENPVDGTDDLLDTDAGLEGGGDEDEEPEAADDEADDDYGPPFEGRSFGGEFAWADTPSFTCKILRVKPGENVIVSTVSRKDMHAMLTGGRAMLEVHSPDGSDQVEMLPAAPIRIEPGHDYRLVAITEVELFVAYAPENPA